MGEVSAQRYSGSANVGAIHELPLRRSPLNEVDSAVILKGAELLDGVRVILGVLFIRHRLDIALAYPGPDLLLGRVQLFGKFGDLVGLPRGARTF